MQAEGGVAGALHGAIATGALATTFTSSQGLMLMVPILFKLANAKVPGVIHVAARAMIRTVASINNDHSDVMACRTTGFAMLAASSVQEVHDLAIAAHIASIKGGIPFLHFYDGFRTSHEVSKIEQLDLDELKSLFPQKDVLDFRKRTFNPEHPTARGLVVNYDTYFQHHDASNMWFLDMPDVFESVCEDIAKVTGRRYHAFDYFGDPHAEHVLVVMGSAADTAEETVEYLNKSRGEKTGVIKVHLYRPFSAKHFLATLPKSAKKITVIDRTREFGADGEPLYLDVQGVMASRGDFRPVINGIYGISGKDITPTMIISIFDNMKLDQPKRHFTVGINDDVTHTSLPSLPIVDTVPDTTKQCIFWGVGADGTVGANREAISIISNETKLNAQGYFIFEAKKSGGWTFSHLRFGPEKIKSLYAIERAGYIACHNESFVRSQPVVDKIQEGGIFVLNTSAKTIEEIEKLLPNSMKRIIAERHVQFYQIDATEIAENLGMRGRINMIMQSCFFKLSNVVDVNTALKLLKNAIRKNYFKKGQKVVDANIKMVDLALDSLHRVDYPMSWSQLDPTGVDPMDKFGDIDIPVLKECLLPTFVGKGNDLPVSAFLTAQDGVVPTGTSKYEKRGTALEIPAWDSKKCVQCNECTLHCPYSCLQPFLITKEDMKKGPHDFDGIRARKVKNMDVKDLMFRIQISPFDCVGCGVCANVCPEGALSMTSVRKIDMKKTSDQWEYAISLPRHDDEMTDSDLRSVLFKEPLLFAPNACGGCGETPVMKLLTQLFGDRMYLANATGCSIVWAATFPSVAYTTNSRGYGPIWGNSLFEDNAEYGFGMLRSVEQRRKNLAEVVKQALSENVFPSQEVNAALQEWSENLGDPYVTRRTSDVVKKWFEADKNRSTMHPRIEEVYNGLDIMTKPSHWLMGGDGWAYDIGYNGVDHVLADASADVNILVLDNESYANTGFQVSKSTPHATVTKFASFGKRGHKKDLPLMTIQYGHVYVASIALGADPRHALRALIEAESYPGPSLVIAYAPCIGHGLHSGMCEQVDEQRLAVDTGYWNLFRYDPRLVAQGKNPFQLDSKKPTVSLSKFLEREVRFTSLSLKDAELAKQLHLELEKDVMNHWEKLEKLAK
eukprot:TRINITY_DN82756_c0_g1_i1.p1 TRINITY_DN82756_c0_g1~~TRINITY_DN82756_c0_g1_i1.p1  ORF type:complete len:1250 (-),score=325.49 TRINITY_DN82756_c0_g1_i1:111-3488(-)